MTSDPYDGKQSLAMIWKQAERDFEKMTGKPLCQPVTLEQALEKIKEMSNGDARDRDKREKIKRRATDVVHFLVLLGGLAGQVTSVTLGPANACFNAIQFLLQIPDKISRFHDQIADLLQEIQCTMGQFEIYKRVEDITKFDPEFLQSASILMASFVRICATCYKFSHHDNGWHKYLDSLETNVKLILFDDDSDVSAALDEFRNLSRQHSRSSDAVTLEHVIKAQRDNSKDMKNIYDTLCEYTKTSSQKLDFLVKVNVDQNNRDAELKSIEDIKSWLGILDSSQKKGSELAQLCDKVLRQTGDWLDGLSKYTQWKNVRAKGSPLLLFAGEENSGKTSLFSSIFRRLNEQYCRPQERQLRVFLASYVFEDNEKTSQLRNKGESNQGSNMTAGMADIASPSIQALKSAAMQFVKNDEVFRRKLWTYLKDNDITLWRDTTIEKGFLNLFSELTMPASNDTYYILLLDGIEKLPGREADDLVNAILTTKTTQLRVALSGTGSVIQASLKACSIQSASSSVVEITSYNMNDIKEYVRDVLTKDKLFQQSSAAIKEVVSEVQNKLPDIVNGNFQTADIVIDNVRQAVRSEKPMDYILSLLSKQNVDNAGVRCEQTVRNLEAVLSREEIQQLNELLIWTVHGMTYFDIERMQAALFLLMGRPIFQDLKIKIEDKFSKFLKVNEQGCLVMSNPIMEDFLKQKPRLHENGNVDNSEEPRISMQISITNAKVSQIQRFFLDLSKETVLGNDSYFKFLNHVSDDETGTAISAHPIDGHLHILRRCFDLLLDEFNDKTHALTPYATGFVLGHLPPCQPKEPKNKLSASEKQFIADRLITFFQSPDSLKVHLTEQFFYSLHLLEEDQLSNALLYLADPVATEKFRVDKRNWARKMTNVHPTTVLNDIALMIANCWLRDKSRRWAANLPYLWLLRFLVLQGIVPKPQPEPGWHWAWFFGEGRSYISDKPDERRTESTVVENGSIYSMGAHTASLQNGPGEAENRGTIITDVEDRDDDAERLDANVDSVQHVLRWVENKIPHVGRDALWFERLGLTYTYLLSGDFKYADEERRKMQVSARELYTKSQNVKKRGWHFHEVFAKFHEQDGNLPLAIDEMSTALGQLRNKKDHTDIEQSVMTQGLLALATWQTKLERTSDAIESLEEVIKSTPNSVEGRFQLLELYYNSNQNSRFVNFITELYAAQGSGEKLNKLGDLLLSISSDNSASKKFEIILVAMSDSDKLQLIHKALHDVNLHMESNMDNEYTGCQKAVIRLYQGMALTHSSNDEENKSKAMGYFTECMHIGFETGELQGVDSALIASRHYFSFSLSHSSLIRDGEGEVRIRISEATKILQKIDTTWEGRRIRLMLASLHLSLGEQEEAEKLLLTDVQRAFGLLSDDKPDNDAPAYLDLAHSLTQLGDHLNALSAWSLSGPDVRYAKTESISDAQEYQLQPAVDLAGDRKAEEVGSPIATLPSNDELSGWSCAGGCKRQFKLTWNDSVCLCQICDGMSFCDPCFNQLRSGQIRHRVCNPGHKWLRIPAIMSEYQATGRDKVRMGGKLPQAVGSLQYGDRIGGEIVPVKVWLDTIREKWSIIPARVDQKAENGA